MRRCRSACSCSCWSVHVPRLRALLYVSVLVCMLEGVLLGCRVMQTRRAGQRAFTLIELLVVVAIIALLIAILLPSLSKARGQARTALCASRIVQLGKAFLVYADDYNECPPFLGVTPGKGFPDWNTEIGGIRDPEENWLVSLPEDWSSEELRDRFYAAYESDWDQHGVDLPRSGTLFEYTRFEQLYRCPEFARVSHPEKTQSAFNYTRPEWCRKFRFPGGTPVSTGIPGFPQEGGWPPQGDFKGDILRLSAVHAPARLMMVGDEQWDRHVARPPEIFGELPDTYHWLDTDPIMALEDEMGQYHAPKVESDYWESGKLIQRGAAFYYDGHVDFRREPIPSNKTYERTYEPAIQAGRAALRIYSEIIYAQRGIDLGQF